LKRREADMSSSDEQSATPDGPSDVPEDPVVPIYRHGERELPFELAIGDSESIEAISAHFERQFGKVDMVWHEIISDLVHIDVHVIRATEERPYHVLFTTGMSDRPMVIPEPDLEPFRYAELVAFLKPEWKIGQEEFQDEANFWPARWLKMLARLPHEYQHWLFEGHTVPYGDPASAFVPGTELCCWLLTAAQQVPDDFSPLTVAPGKDVYFLNAVPIYKDEMQIKLRGGDAALFAHWELNGLDPMEVAVIDPKRPKSRKPNGAGWWPFGGQRR
jgi:hypothetical protein